MPPAPKIVELRFKSRFSKDLRSLAPEIQAAAKEAISALQCSPIPKRLRLHSLNGYQNPKVFTIDVTSNKAYKISLEIDGHVATLRRIATHRIIDDCP